jgi:hypothetical protein
MKNIQNVRKKSPAKPPATGHTNPAGLYDRHGPIPVADVNESDADSVWALFQDSQALQDGDSVLPADDAPFQKTVPAPLKP